MLECKLHSYSPEYVCWTLTTEFVRCGLPIELDALCVWMYNLLEINIITIYVHWTTVSSRLSHPSGDNLELIDVSEFHHFFQCFAGLILFLFFPLYLSLRDCKKSHIYSDNWRMNLTPLPKWVIRAIRASIRTILEPLDPIRGYNSYLFWSHSDIFSGCSDPLPFSNCLNICDFFYSI